jgi:hypothetical protein
VRAQGQRIGGGAGRDDARDFALDQLLGDRGIFHLVADGYAVALLDEARDVAFGRVIGDAAHGDGAPFSLLREVGSVVIYEESGLRAPRRLGGQAWRPLLA